MIAKNFRQFPDAMAVQMVLPFGRPVWNGQRPSTRIGRLIRSAQAALVVARPQIVEWVKAATPQWWKDLRRAQNALSASIKAACMLLL